MAGLAGAAGEGRESARCRTTRIRGGAALAVAAVMVAAGLAADAGAGPAEPSGSHVVRRRLGRTTATGPLGLPFQQGVAASDLYCFGLDPWSADGEVHGGIDVVAAHSGEQPAMISVAVVAPAPGRVEWVVSGTTGDGHASILVVLRLNDLWFVLLTIEPQSASQATNNAQAAAVYVVPGQTVAAGEVIADLVVWHIAAGSYPHVHLGLLYKNPAQSLEDVRDHILEVAVSDGTGLPPRHGPGSPLDPRDLGLPTTFFCPYAFSTAAARASYDALTAHAANGDLCACPCAYRSVAGNCGDCSRSELVK